MSNMVSKLAKTAGVSAEDAKAVLEVIDMFNPKLVGQRLAKQIVESIEKEPDFTPNEREWMMAFASTESYEVMLCELVSKCGIERTFEALSDEDSDLNYYSYLIDEDPEKIAAAYATEMIERYAS